MTANPQIEEGAVGTHGSHLGSTVVVGGSVAGLLAAAAAAAHAQRVVLVERDPLRPEPGPRPGTPQAEQIHGLLASGREAMECLLPGLTGDLVAQGGHVGDIGTEARWYLGGHRVAGDPVGAVGLGVSRPLLEAYLRARVRELPQVTVLERCDARALLWDGRGAVTGVRVHHLDEPTGAEESLPAEVVVDATGRPGRASGWFAEQGWPVPRQERIVIGVRYTTVHVEHREGDLDGAGAVLVSASSSSPRTAAAVRQEDGTWIVGVGGYLEQQPPTDPDGLRAFARGLAAPEIAELLGRELLHPGRTYRFAHSVRRRVERVRLPQGYAVLGDALCSFNPVFGQGMSVAALQAVALGEALASVDASDGLPAALGRYHRQAVARVDHAWQLVLGSDLQIPGVVGRRPRGHSAVSAYLRRVQSTASRDPVVARTLLRVTALLEPPQALFRPTVAARVAVDAGHRPARPRTSRPAPAGTGRLSPRRRRAP